MTLANVYCPNSKQVPFLQDVFMKLTLFHIGLLILGGGDFNVLLNPLLDTSNGSLLSPSLLSAR